MRFRALDRSSRSTLENALSAFDYGKCQLDPQAAAAMARLAPLLPDANVEALRKRYVQSRLPLVGPREDVAKIVQIQSSSGSVPSLTIFRPGAGEALLPALVYLHGGGWTHGGGALYEPVLCQLANALGHVVVAVEYRLAPEHPFPAALEDSWNALDWVAANAASLGVDKDRIAIGGDGAGGNLAAVTALAARNGLLATAPRYQLLIYPCLDMTAGQPSHDEFASGYVLTRDLYAWYRAHYVAGFPDSTDWHLSPLLASDLSGVSPAIVLYAGFDPFRDEAALYCALLARAGVPVEGLFFPGMIHDFLTMGGAIPAATVAVRRIASVVAALQGSPRDRLTAKHLAAPPHDDRIVLHLGMDAFANEADFSTHNL